MVGLSTLALLGLALGQVSADGLNVRAKAAGKQYFGSGIVYSDISTGNTQIVGNISDFGQLTPGNEMKWDATEPSRNSFSYTRGDAIADYAASNGQLLRCHTLVWHSQLPSWVSNGGFNNQTLIDIMVNHITQVVTHYKGKCFHWDVVNEALNEDGTYRESVFYKTIGEAYLPIAFKAAAAADPAAKLYYNDYNIEQPGSKSTGAQRIVKLIQSYGVKIDGVGMQAHLIVGSVGSASGLVSNINGFTSLGVDAAYTEVDIRAKTPISSSNLIQQATDYSTVISACKAVARCVGVTIWGWTDRGSWIPDVFPGYGDALPWDANDQKKPAYDAILNAWGPVPTTTTTTTTTTATTTTPTATSTSSPVTYAERWGQCAGNGWTGPTTCRPPYTCKYLNDWYSQCQ